MNTPQGMNSKSFTVDQKCYEQSRIDSKQIIDQAEVLILENYTLTRINEH